MYSNVTFQPEQIWNLFRCPSLKYQLCWPEGICSCLLLPIYHNYPLPAGTWMFSDFFLWVHPWLTTIFFLPSSKRASRSYSCVSSSSPKSYSTMSCLSVWQAFSVAFEVDTLLATFARISHAMPAVKYFDPLMNLTFYGRVSSAMFILF